MHAQFPPYVRWDPTVTNTGMPVDLQFMHQLPTAFAIGGAVQDV